MTAVHLAHHVAAPLHPRAREAFLQALDTWGDPLAASTSGREARAVLDGAREAVAAGIGVQADEIVLTSGGTESVALGLVGAAIAGRDRGDRVIVSAVEHPAVMGTAAFLESIGFRSIPVPVDGHGRLDVDRFAAEVRAPGTVVASVQHANQEVGTIQPVAEAADVARAAGVPFHTDACQTVGRLGVDAAALGVDLLSLSGRKLGGPPGIGALYVRRGLPFTGFPRGDDRERHRRSGAPNLPGAAAMAAVLDAAREEMADQAAHQWALTGHLRAAIEDRIAGARLHGHPTQRTPHLACFSVEGIDPEVLLLALDERGFHLDGGSVASGSPHEPSQVLAAMGVPDTVALRAGVGPETTEHDIDRFVDALQDLVTNLARLRAT